ncbi:MAG TPA: MBOAT family O-acyltransferase [Planctomycetota bacterium]|jgi:alginate O-acetyltransferase complex protein AlgI|nr:MBOAT family O-acyltransferase [Planctomycetota bacterium]
MIFTEFRFLFFFLAVFCVHWSLRSNRSRKVWLLLTSYAFYAGWDWRFLSLLLISTVVDYLAGRGIAATPDERTRKRWVAFSCITNLGLLGVFKYRGFFVDSAREFLSFLGLDVGHSTLSIVLPVGISFYTFQTLSYTLDVYRGRCEVRKSPLDLALFVAFFPQLVAGPVVRARRFLPQLDSTRRFADVEVRALVLLFLVGFFKKACISDNVHVLVDAFFADPAAYTFGAAWSAVTLFTVQIYCDFSGYSDMAVACGGLLGYRLPVNFRFPYLAGNVRDAWQRWHISITTWFRDYFYAALGGGRGSSWQAARNVLLTMLVVGIWHGPSWRFVLWGGAHGVALIFHRWWSGLKIARALRRKVPGAVWVGVTFVWACTTMILFRAPDLATAWTTLGSFLAFRSPGSASFGAGPFLLLAFLAALHVGARRHLLRRHWQSAPSWAFSLLCGVFAGLILILMKGVVQPFIYFQF